MPFLDMRSETPVELQADAFRPLGQDALDAPAAAPPKPDPNGPSLVGAAFRQSNMIASALSAEALSVGDDIDPSFDAWAFVKGTPYEARWQNFTGAFNLPRAQAIARDIDREDEDRRRLAQSPIAGTLLEIGASIADPTILIPGAAVAKGARAGATVARSALAVGASAAAQAAVQEGALQATQQLRTGEETALAVGGSFLLGGLVGGAGGYIFRGADWGKASAAIDRSLADAPDAAARLSEFEAGVAEGIRAEAGSVGAAAAPRRSLEDLDLSGAAARQVGQATAWLNPANRLASSPIAETREIGERLLKNSTYLSMHEEGRTLGVAAETAMIEHTGRNARALQSMGEIWAESRKTIGMTEQEFRETVGRAMRRGDVADPADDGAWASMPRRSGEDEAAYAARRQAAAGPVSAAAKAWRSTLFDPLKDQAIGQRLLPEDVQPETAVSYFSRAWKREKLIAQEPQFKEIVTEHYARTLGGEYAAARAKVAGDLAEIDAEIAAARAAAGPADDTIVKLATRRASIERAFYDAWEVERAGENVSIGGGRADFREAARAIADEVFDKLTGRNLDVAPDGLRITAKAVGPLKERTFNVPDALIEDFLDHDVSTVGKRYARLMGADVELARQFGTPDMAEAFTRIREGYRRLRDRLDPADEAGRRALDKREQADLKDIGALRDMLRGQYRPDYASQTFDKVVRSANALNYIRLMGGVITASLNDIARPAMVHGLEAFGTGPLARLLGSNLKKEAIGLSIKEAQLAGNVLERVQASRLASLVDVTDPYRTETALDLFLRRMTEKASTWNGIRWWTDTMKGWASTVTQNRVLRGAESYGSLPERERAYLAFLGIDRDMAERIAKQAAEHGEEVEGVRVAGSGDWGDEGARRTFYGAINKDVDSIIIQPSVGDLPLFVHTPLGKAALQFKSFTLAANQRILLRGLQEDQTRFWGGVMAMSSIGAFIAFLKAYEGNRQNKLSDNPGFWIGEGLDRSGILGLPFEISNTAEKLGLYGIKKAGVDLGEVLFPGVSGAEGANRYSSRGKAGALAGPTVGMIEDAATVMTIPESWARDGKVTDAQKTAGKNLIPFGTYPGMKQLLNYAILPPNDQKRPWE
ncbi:hypothetical protein [Methylobacterium iners]|uniref:Uncharacterized protein n=1 Tax=Methylobacterium iners TaxID=418707 RepID=A0ABQ4RS01_9HYPH|nr:hypothetical protein [Methylobacterium iners]GJD92938.1 hypothetical protein OCOJLMKI_0121 [Methylobacterium iners]